MLLLIIIIGEIEDPPLTVPIHHNDIAIIVSHLI